MNGVGRDWFFRTAKSLKKCAHCGHRASFHTETVVLIDEHDRAAEFVVRVCDHCGEYNGEVDNE